MRPSQANTVPAPRAGCASVAQARSPPAASPTTRTPGRTRLGRLPCLLVRVPEPMPTRAARPVVHATGHAGRWIAATALPRTGGKASLCGPDHAGPNGPAGAVRPSRSARGSVLNWGALRPIEANSASSMGPVHGGLLNWGALRHGFRRRGRLWSAAGCLDRPGSGKTRADVRAAREARGRRASSNAPRSARLYEPWLPRVERSSEPLAGQRN